MFARVLEDEAAPRNEVLDRLGNEHLRGTGEGAYAGTDHHAEASNVIAFDRDLACVQSRPYLDPERTDRRGDRRRAAHPACRPVERREEPIAHRLDLASAVPGDLRAHDLVVAGAYIAPAGIT